jgi:acyl carrier protein
MVASFGDRPVTEVGERIDSIQLAWLVHQVEQRYGVQLELDDAQYGRMSTITGAVEVLREAVMVVEDA